MKLTSILLLSLGLVSGVASAGGTTEAGVGGALGGVLGAVVGQQLGGSTGSAIGAGVGGAAGSAVAPTNAAVAKQPLAARWVLQAVTCWAAVSAAAQVPWLARPLAVVPVARWATIWAIKATATIAATVIVITVAPTVMATPAVAMRTATAKTNIVTTTDVHNGSRKAPVFFAWTSLPRQIVSMHYARLFWR